MGDYVRLLRHNRDYRFLCFAVLTSLLGDWFNLIASAELVTSLTSSGTALSLLFLTRFVPSFIISPFAGVLADRVDRRKLMIAADWLRGLVVLGFLFVRTADQVWLLYLLTIIQFALSAFFCPAKQAVLSQVVARDELVTANALDATTWSVMLFVARLPQQLPTKKVEKESGFGEIVGGVRYLIGVPFLLAAALAKAAGSLVWGAVNVLEIKFADEVFGGGALTLGLIYAVTGLGTGIGPLVLRKWFGDSRQGLTYGIHVSFMFLTVGLMGLAWSPTLGWLLFMSAVRTFGSGGMWVFSSALLQKFVPDRVRGRVFAFEFAMLTMTQSISILWAGQALDVLGLQVRFVAAIQAVIGSMVVIWWGTVLLRYIRKPLDEEERDNK